MTSFRPSDTPLESGMNQIVRHDVGGDEKAVRLIFSVAYFPPGLIQSLLPIQAKDIVNDPGYASPCGHGPRNTMDTVRQALFIFSVIHSPPGLTSSLLAIQAQKHRQLPWVYSSIWTYMYYMGQGTPASDMDTVRQALLPPIPHLD